MLTVHPLYSSSSGNMFHIASCNANILIDVGVSYKAINEGLKSIGLTLDDIDAIFITHEHSDHIKGLPLLCRKNTDKPIYAVGKTANYIIETLTQKNIMCNILPIKYDTPIKIKDMEIYAFETSHDAIMPCGYRIKTEDKTLTIATDLGYVSNEVYSNLADSDFTILESNYDNTMLEFGKYPYLLKRRIKGQQGHLSNDICGQTIAKLASEGHSRFLLAHLSENNNTQELALQTVESILTEKGLNPQNIEINLASKTLSNEGYTIC